MEIWVHGVHGCTVISLAYTARASLRVHARRTFGKSKEMRSLKVKQLVLPSKRLSLSLERTSPITTKQLVLLLAGPSP